MIILNTTPLTPPAYKPITISITFSNAKELSMMQDFLQYRTTVASNLYLEKTDAHVFVSQLLAGISKELK